MIRAIAVALFALAMVGCEDKVTIEYAKCRYMTVFLPDSIEVEIRLGTHGPTALADSVKFTGCDQAHWEGWVIRTPRP